jgi:hypothetical protein
MVTAGGVRADKVRAGETAARSAAEAVRAERVVALASVSSALRAVRAAGERGARAPGVHVPVRTVPPRVVPRSTVPRSTVPRSTVSADPVTALVARLEGTAGAGTPTGTRVVLVPGRGVMSESRSRAKAATIAGKAAPSRTRVAAAPARLLAPVARLVRVVSRAASRVPAGIVPSALAGAAPGRAGNVLRAPGGARGIVRVIARRVVRVATMSVASHRLETAGRKVVPVADTRVVAGRVPARTVTVVSAVPARTVRAGRRAAPAGPGPGPAATAHRARAAIRGLARGLAKSVMIVPRPGVPRDPVGAPAGTVDRRLGRVVPPASAGTGRPGTAGWEAVPTASTRAVADRARGRAERRAPAVVDGLAMIGSVAAGESAPVTGGRRHAMSGPGAAGVPASPGVRPRTASARARSTTIRCCPMR